MARRAVEDLKGVAAEHRMRTGATLHNAATGVAVLIVASGNKPTDRRYKLRELPQATWRRRETQSLNCCFWQQPTAYEIADSVAWGNVVKFQNASDLSVAKCNAMPLTQIYGENCE
jgi:hypothetical protein